MFVVEDNGRYYQEKYQYFDVYVTKNGRWAGSYSQDDYSYTNHYFKGTSIKPEKIDFVEEVAYPIQFKTDTTDGNQHLFPEPYFKTVNNKAIAVYGNYVEDLFRLKKEGILSMRGLFGDIPPDTIFETKMADIAVPSKDKRFRMSWKFFTDAVQKADNTFFEKALLDSIWICEKIVSKKQFMNEYYEKVFDSATTSKFNKESQTKYMIRTIDTADISPYAKNVIRQYLGKYCHLEVELIKSKDPNDTNMLTFVFIKTATGIKLYKCYDSQSQCFR